MLCNNAKVIICAILACFCTEVCAYNQVNVQEEFIITEEDIQNAIPTKAEVLPSKKQSHEIEVMEIRHFERTCEDENIDYRVAKLEKFLLGRTWEFSPLKDRMNRLKLASQRRMLAGTSLPLGIRKYVSPQRIANDSAQEYDDNSNVGIIDGLLKLYAPEAYESWSRRKKRLNERYNDG